MYRPTFSQHIEAIKKEFEMLAQENKAMKGMMKDHEERALFIKKEIKTLKSCVFTIQQQIRGQKCDMGLPKIYKPTQLSHLKLKIGAGWCVENDHLADIKLERTVAFSSAISSLEMSPDGRWVALACNQAVYVYALSDRTLRSLNMKTGAIETAEIHRKVNVIREYDIKIVFSRCSRFLYTETGEVCLRKWDLETSEVKRIEFEHHVAAWVAMGDGLVVASQAGVFMVHGEGVDPGLEETRVCAMAWVAEEVLALGTLCGKVVLFNCTTKAQNEFLVHRKGVRSLDFSENGAFLLSGSLDKTIVVSKITAETLDLEVVGDPFVHEDVVLSTKFLRNTECFVSGSRDYTVRLWNSDRKEMRICAHEGPVVGVSVHGSTLVSASVDRKLRIWRLTLK